MTGSTKWKTVMAVCLVALAAMPAMTWAEESQKPSNWLALADKPADKPADKSAAAAPAAAAPAPAEAAKWEKPGFLKAVSLGVEYTLASDYVWRGLNLSEYSGEGREKPNHQLNLSFEIDTSKLCDANLGRIGGSIWFEWFAGQENLTTWSENNLQEVDYTVYWAYDLDCGLSVELGWIAYHLPRYRDSGSTVSANSAYTNEVYVKLSYDDAKIFGQSMFSPYIAYFQDVDNVQAGILAFGVSHDFALAKMGCKDVCILKDITITPAFAVVLDHRYYDKAGVGGGPAVGTRLGYLEYGLSVGYDLSSALSIPEQFGTLGLKGFLTFDQSLHNEAASVHDEFFGGVKLSWGW